MKQTTPMTLKPITCTPWCEQADGHPGEACREDQSRMGASYSTELLAADAVLVEDASQPSTLEAYAFQTAASEGQVNLSINGAPTAQLSLSGARELREA
jgi:hypothetical protein